MTPAALARQAAISFECKKDALQQRQSGDWKISFTVQGVDMDERITRAAMGTRFMAVLVEINDDETPVSPAAKESPATPQPQPQPRQAGAKRDWRDLQPATQAGIRCDDATFHAFLLEEFGFDTSMESERAAVVVRQICKVESRSEFSTSIPARLRWQALDDKFQAWKAMEHA